MKISTRWLGEMVDLEAVAPDAIERLITFHVAEVEGAEAIGSALEGVVTARVSAVRPHPNADRLRLCTVQLADGDASGSQEVVCGAPNVAEGQVVAYAPVGVTLPGGEDGPITLEAREIRGIESRGMICAEDELGLGDDHSGIIVLDAVTPLGVPLSQVLATQDTILELENKGITHRPDLWGHVGFARELGALLGRRPSLPEGTDLQAAAAEATGNAYPVHIDHVQGCSRYMATVIDGLENGPSPLWLRRRLASLGVRSIDRIVDLTNLVLLEQGQPLHAFDMARLSGEGIVVRAAEAGERFTTLDEVERTLESDDLVIADGTRAVALAGVMGGLESGVRPETTSILLEAAHFDAGRVRRTAARLGLRTDASTRFEKSLDPHGVLRATARFVALAQQLMPGARLRAAPTDVFPAPPEARIIRLPLSLVRRRLGLRISDAAVKSRLHALGFKAREEGPDLYVEVPSWRAGKDVSLAEDLVEEVGRIHGYQRVPSIVPVAPMGVRKPGPLRAFEREAATALAVDLGYAEVKGHSFYGDAEIEVLGLGDVAHMRLTHPQSDLQTRLIQTAVPHLLRAAARNAVRAPEGAVWDSTRVVAPPLDQGLAREVRALAGLTWSVQADGSGQVVLALVADVRRLLRRLGLSDLHIEQDGVPRLHDALPSASWLHPGRSAGLTCAGERVGYVGELLPSVVRAFEARGRIACFELDLEALLRARQAGEGLPYVAPLRYPVVPFDVALFVPRKTPAAEVGGVIQAALPDHVRHVRCFDVYEGEGVDEGMKSLAFRCELYHRERTLKGKDAERMRKQVLAALGERGWALRTS